MNISNYNAPWLLVASNNSMASRDSDGGSDGGDHSVMDHQIQEVSYWGLHRCWWRMLETKCVGDNLEMLVTVSGAFVTNILYLLAYASGTNIEVLSLTSKNCHQDKVTNNHMSSTFM